MNQSEPHGDLLEYALLVALIALVAVATVTATGKSLPELWHRLLAAF